MNDTIIDYNMPEETYHADPCETPSLSSSIIKTLLNQSPRHAAYEHPKLTTKVEEESDEDDTKFDLGKTAHSLMLRDPRNFEIIKPDDYPSKQGGIPKGWTNNAIREARDAAYAAGKTPLLPKQWDKVNAMVAAGREQTDAFTNGKPEVTLAWQEDNGVWCRIRIDWLKDNLVEAFDYKTGAVYMNPDRMENYALSLGWHITSAFYKRGMRKVLGVQMPKYEFIAHENFAPFCLSHVAMNAEAEERADKLIDKAIHVWGECLASGVWPAYPKQTVQIGLPSYYINRIDEIAEREAA